MIDASAQTTIDAPVEDVFDVLADATNEPKWLPGAQRVEKVTPGPLAEGTRFEGTYARAGNVSLELVTFRPPNGLTFRARSKIVEFDDAVRLIAEDGGTRLEARMSARPRGIMRLLEPVLARTMRKQFAENWPHLAAYVESQR